MGFVGESVPFGEFELIRRLGVGGMAEVFLVKRLGPDGFQKRLVIKRLLPHLNRSDAFIELFLKEAQMAALVDHPNVAHVSDFGQVDGRHYLAMEYVDGLTVTDFMEKVERARPGVVARVASEVLAGLEALHSARGINGERLNLVHRDITPRNVMLTRGGNIKLIDLGIAVQAMQEDQQQAGTKNHMSPEQAQGQPVDRRADIYSVALLMLRMLCGRIEVEAKSPHPDRPEGVPDALWPLLQKALSYQPEARYESARAFQRALERSAAAQGEESSPSYLSELVESVMPSLTQAMRLDLGDIASRAGPVTETAAPEDDVSGELTPKLDTQAKLQAVLEEGDKTPLMPGFGEEQPTWENDPPNTRVQRGPIPRIHSQRDAAPTRALMELPREEPMERSIGSTRSVVRLDVPKKRRGRSVVLVLLLGLGGFGLLRATKTSEPSSASAPVTAKAPGVERGVEPAEASASAPAPRQLERADAPKSARLATKAPRPKRTKRRRSRPRAPSKRALQPGFLAINTKPWTRVYVDGKKIDVTPIAKTELKAGRHKLRMVNPEAKIDRTVVIRVEPGKIVRYFRNFEPKP